MWQRSLWLTLAITSVAAVTKRQEAFVRGICNKVLKQGELLPTCVRLAFHDCVGGCNGCVDLTNSDNAGLGICMSALEVEFDENNIGRFMSRADFWAVCFTEGIYMANKRSKLPDRYPRIDLKFGRKTCRTGQISPNQPAGDKFPSPKTGCQEVLKFFRDEFGWNAEQVVTILGTHTIGECHKRNSGFDGPWKDAEDEFDHRYFTALTNREFDWTQINIREDGEDGPEGDTSPRWQFVHAEGKRNVMLDVDACLFKEIHPDADGKVEPAKLFQYPNASITSPFVTKFALSNKEFLASHSKVFSLMIHHMGRNSQVQLRPPTNN